MRRKGLGLEPKSNISLSVSLGENLLKSNRSYSKSSPVFSQVVANGRSKVALSNLLPVREPIGCENKSFCKLLTLRVARQLFGTFLRNVFSIDSLQPSQSLLWGIRFHGKDPEGWLSKTQRKLPSVWFPPATACVRAGQMNCRLAPANHESPLTGNKSDRSTVPSAVSNLATVL